MFLVVLTSVVFYAAGRSARQSVVLVRRYHAWQVWGESFSEKMAIRPESQHKQCHICVRHKCILKGLGNDRLSRARQMDEYRRHLARQYQDRVAYYRNRSQSRLKQLLPEGVKTLAVIIDGMDHGKYKFPRTFAMCSKELAGLNRPSLDLVCCIAHGYGLWMIATLPHVCKDSNLNVDILSHVLHCLMEKGLDCRTVSFKIQCDNTVRECKNNVTLRWLGCLVSSHRLKRAEVNSLTSGHSHEDVDQHFSVLSHAIQKEKELHVPEDFVRMLQKLHEDHSLRPEDPVRRVELVSAVREWKHGGVQLMMRV